MAIFFDHQVQAPDTGGNVDISWHDVEPLLAVASRNDGGGGFVQLYNEEGEPIPDAVMQRSCFSSSKAWYPTKPILAVGWNNGEVLIWNHKEKELYEAAKIHKEDVCLLCWSVNGQRLLSGDKSGLLVLWKTDNRGRPQPVPVCQQETQQTPRQCIFPPGQETERAEEMKALARAAVRGDEKALDMFSWRKDPTSSKSNLPGLGGDGNSCYVGGADGKIYFIKENGSFSEVANVESDVKKLLYNKHRNILVIITKSMLLSQYSVSVDGKLTEMMKVKLSGRVTESDCDMVWAGKGLLATATGECLIRMWDLDKDDNYVLGLDSKQGFMTGECINCVAFSEKKGILAAGTDQGHIAMWKYAPAAGILGRKQDGEAKWKVQLPSVMEGSVLQLKWGTSQDLLCMNTLDKVFILSQHIMSSYMNQQVAVVQTGPANLSVDLFSKGTHLELKTDVHVRGICNTKDNLAIWNGKKAVIYEIGLTIRAAGTFVTESPVLVLHEQSVYTTEPGKIQVRNFQGTVKQLISLTEQDGEPVLFDVCEKFLVVVTDTHMIKVFDVSRREAKPHNNPRNMADLVPKVGVIRMAKINSNGTKVAFICDQNDGMPDSKVYIWDVDLDSIGFFDFSIGLGDQEDLPSSEKEEDLSDIERGKRKAAADISGRYPINIHWDSEEKKLLVCEAKLVVSSEATTPRKMTTITSFTNTPADVIVVSLFSTLEQGILMQDSFALNTGYDKLIGVEVPYYYFIKKTGEKSEEGVLLSEKSSVCRQVMRDFVGLEDGDKNSRDAMMNFSFFVTIGNMDEAFKAIKLIKSESVWENMAKMCVKTRRLDVAKVCLGNMGHARGAKALREAEKEPELDARVAMLAIQLGMLEEAERLYKNCERFDLLNELYQASGQWGKAMETAELRDRIHLRTTYYNYAKHLEAKGDFNGAIPNYEKSDTHRFEVPRMLFEEPQALEAYIMKNKDKALRKWWAQYMESTGDLETALQFYEAAQDYLSLVRIHCYCGALDKACEIANETGDRAACYHLARQHELQEQYKEAVHFFTRAQAYSQAIRMCKEHDMGDQLMNLALMSTKDDMIEAARYYEANPESQDKAVMLYHKGGHFSKALELAFESQQFGALQLISDDLDEKTDPVLLNRCAEFFMEHGQFDKAVDLFVVGGKYFEALELCQQHSVKITEKLAEKMTLAKDDAQGEMRMKLLEKVADLCFLQGSYHLATKKYTQAGNKGKAMKALLKSGDTEKIIFFAGVSRQKEIYVMAANYLQSLDWRKDPEIMKNIIGFYTKGRALDSLAGFYDACAQVEIDEYQNYDKALGALSEAYKCLTKAKMKNQSLQEEKLAALKHRIGLVKKFVQARRTYDEDSEEAMKQCQVLLEEPDLDSAVRVGDVFGMIIEHYARQEDFRKAYSFMEEMRARIPTVNMAYYINMKTIETVHKALDIPMGRGMGVKESGDNEDEEDEELEEELEGEESFA